MKLCWRLFFIFCFLNSTSIVFAQTAEEILDTEKKIDSEKDTAAKTYLYWNLSEYYKDMDSSLSMYYLNKVFDFSGKQNNFYGLALYHLSLAIRSSQIENYTIAADENKLAQKYFLLYKDTLGYLDAIDGQLRILYFINQPDSLIAVGKSVLDKVYGKKYELRLGKINYLIGLVFAEKKSPLAVRYFDKANVLISKTTNNKFLLPLYVSICKYYNSVNKIDSAIKYARKAVEFSKNVTPSEISYINAATILSILLQKKGEFIEANKLDRSIAKATLAMRYKEQLFLKKNTQVNILKEKEKNEIVKKTILFFCIGILMVAIIIGILIFNKNRKRNLLLSNTNEKLGNSLAHNQILLKELHHRVRNNIQIVLGLLYLQYENADKLSTKELVKLVASRIETISKINEHLHLHPESIKLEVREYFEWLIQSVIQNFNIHNKDIRFACSGIQHEIDIDKLFPLGLIVNELVINSMKHAFINQQSGLIEVFFEQMDDLFLLTYKDNGIGIDMLKVTDSSLGMKLIKVLVQQLEGDFTIKDAKGFSATISLKQG